MPAWREAKRAGQAAENRHNSARQYLDTYVFRPRFTAESGRCFRCGESTGGLHTGTIARIPILYCRECEEDFRSTKALAEEQ